MLKKHTFAILMTDSQLQEFNRYIEQLEIEEILFGLRFAFNRQNAIDGGYLMPGRKSKVKRETHMLSREQAKWRIKNWKSMIKTYREKGYSYPTISRIKKQIRKMAEG